MTFDTVKTPCYICEEELLENNLKLINKRVGRRLFWL